MATTYMNLSLPTVLGTQGPSYASNINDALTAIDAHDHTTGKGIKITPAALNINADLPMGGQNLTGARALRMNNQSAVLAVSGDVTEIYAKSGDLYYNNAAGTPVQITSGSGLNAGIMGGFGGQYVGSAALASYDDTAKSYSFLQAPSTYAQMQTGNITVNHSAPGVALSNLTPATYSYRMGGDVLGEWHLSVDTAGTRAVNSSGHYNSKPSALVCSIFSGQPSFGVNCSPDVGVFQVRNIGNDPVWTAWFQNLTDQATVGIQGTVTTTVSSYSAALSFQDGVRDWDIGLLGSLGATGTGGTQGDFAISGPPGQSCFVIRRTTGAVGIHAVNPVNKLDIGGAVGIGSYAGVNAAPTSGLIVSGQVCFGTATPSGSAALTVSGTQAAGGNITASANTYTVGTAASPFAQFIANTTSGFAFPSAQAITYRISAVGKLAGIAFGGATCTVGNSVGSAFIPKDGTHGAAAAMAIAVPLGATITAVRAYVWSGTTGITVNTVSVLLWSKDNTASLPVQVGSTAQNAAVGVNTATAVTIGGLSEISAGATYTVEIDTAATTADPTTNILRVEVDCTIASVPVAHKL